MEPSQTSLGTCRIKPEGNFDAFHLELIKDDDGILEIIDTRGQLPLDAFDEINEAISEDDESGRVHSEERDQHYAWELIPPEGTEPEDHSGDDFDDSDIP